MPSLYIIAAQHELAHLSPSAARVLLQRGIRLNAESVEMWKEYVKFELGFVESMRRRWVLLGIDVDEKGKKKAQESAEEGLSEGEVEQIQTEADGDGSDAEQARRAIMQGAIVNSVISNAAKGTHENFPQDVLLTIICIQLCLKQHYSRHSTHYYPHILRPAIYAHLALTIFTHSSSKHFLLNPPP